MTNINPAHQNHNKIEKLINSSRFNESISLLKSQFKMFPSLKKEQDKVEKNESTYRFMLDYLFEGHEDPTSKEMLDQMKDSLHHSNDILLKESLLKDSSDIYSSTKRLFILNKTNLQQLLDEYNRITQEAFKDSPDQKDKILTYSQSNSINEMFNYVWTIFGSDQEEYEMLHKTILNEETPYYLKSLLISAIILGNISFFDPESFDILLNLYESSDSVPLRAKIITGILLISLLYPKRIGGNLNIRSRLMLTSKDTEFKNLINEVIINIIRTYDTKRIDNKMRNEVIPGLMKIKPEIIDKMRNLASDSDNFLSEGNPEWEEMIENSEIGKKLQEINDMQLEGADVMVTAFSNLKGFPFFSKISNWFLPFIPGNQEFSFLSLDNNDKSISGITAVMCDSDLHSFLLSLGTIPESNRNIMIQNMQNQMKEVNEVLSNSFKETDQQLLNKKVRHSLQDIYRFFKFYRKKDDFNDPFGKAFTHSAIEPLIPIFDIESDLFKLIGEFYFKNKYYEEAAGIFTLVDALEPGNFKNWEKIGFCYDRLKRYGDAVKWYIKADIINPGNPWLEKKLAIALKNEGRIEESLKYYEKALAKEPDNYHLLMSAGECMLQLGQTMEALQQFYHAQYINPNKLDSLRAVAWAELMAGNLIKSNNHYINIIANPEAKATDFLNAAHSALSSGDLKNSKNLYNAYIEKTEEKKITNLLLALRDDAEILKQLGIKTSDLRLIVDKIRYDRSEDNKG